MISGGKANMSSPAGSLSTSSTADGRVVAIMAVLIVFYAVLRLIAWHNTDVVDSTDSMFYLKNIDAYYSLNLDSINELNSDSTPFYPVSAALAKLLTGDTESAGRLVSFVFSLVLVIGVALLARVLDQKISSLLAVLVLALNAPMISLSVGLFSEMSYIGTIYLGFFLLWRQLQRPGVDWKWAVGLGLLYGLAFLNRTEGIIYLVAIPLAMFLFRVPGRDREQRPSIGRLFGWSLVYVAVFLVLAIPQVVHVSSKMGVPAINGRIAWQTLASGMPDRSLDAAIFGLDFVDDEVNISYIRANYPEAVQHLAADASGSRLGQRLKASLRNMDKINRDYIGEQITPLGFTLTLVGLAALYLARKFRELFYSLFLLGVLMAGPILHTSVNPRHMAAVIPLLCVLQGVGIRQTVSVLTVPAGKWVVWRPVVYIMVIGSLIGGALFPLKRTLKPPQWNNEYDSVLIAEPVRLVKEMVQVPAISAQRGYLAYLTGARFVFAPHSDYEGLIHYLQANDIGLFYVDFKNLAEYPYIDRFREGGLTRHFEAIWVSGQNSRRPAALYRFKALNKS